MNNERIDVLAVMDAAAVGMEGPVRERRGHRDRLFEARAALAELIEAAKKAQAMMAIPGRIEPRHRQELCDAIARCEVVADPRLARVQAGA